MLTTRYRDTLDLIEEATSAAPDNGSRLIWTVPKGQRSQWWKRLAQELGATLEKSDSDSQASMAEGGVVGATIVLPDGPKVHIEAYSKFAKHMRGEKRRKKQYAGDYQFWAAMGQEHQEFSAKTFPELVHRLKAAISEMRRSGA